MLCQKFQYEVKRGQSRQCFARVELVTLSTAIAGDSTRIAPHMHLLHVPYAHSTAMSLFTHDRHVSYVPLVDWRDHPFGTYRHIRCSSIYIQVV
jgi:hypothetical protein